MEASLGFPVFQIFRIPRDSSGWSYSSKLIKRDLIGCWQIGLRADNLSELFHDNQFIFSSGTLRGRSGHSRSHSLLPTPELRFLQHYASSSQKRPALLVAGLSTKPIARTFALPAVTHSRRRSLGYSAVWTRARLNYENWDTESRDYKNPHTITLRFLNSKTSLFKIGSYISGCSSLQEFESYWRTPKTSQQRWQECRNSTAPSTYLFNHSY